jgi:hypothetical protein
MAVVVPCMAHCDYCVDDTPSLELTNVPLPCPNVVPTDGKRETFGVIHVARSSAPASESGTHDQELDSQ